jgi:hypothetical protein
MFFVCSLTLLFLIFQMPVSVEHASNWLENTLENTKDQSQNTRNEEGFKMGKCELHQRRRSETCLLLLWPW